MSTNAITVKAESDPDGIDSLIAENLIPQDLDAAIETALELKSLSTAGEKLSNLNDEGRNALNNAGADLKVTARVLNQLLHSDKEKIQLQAAKFIFERHSGKLDGTKEHSDHGIVINIGQQLVNNNQGSIFNPDPVRKQIA